MYGNYIKWMQIIFGFYESMYNLFDYLTYQCVFFIFFSNNVGSYDS